MAELLERGDSAWLDRIRESDEEADQASADETSAFFPHNQMGAAHNQMGAALKCAASNGHTVTVRELVGRGASM